MADVVMVARCDRDGCPERDATWYGDATPAGTFWGEVECPVCASNEREAA